MGRDGKNIIIGMLIVSVVMLFFVAMLILCDGEVKSGEDEVKYITGDDGKSTTFYLWRDMEDGTYTVLGSSNYSGDYSSIIIVLEKNGKRYCMDYDPMLNTHQKLDKQIASLVRGDIVVIKDGEFSVYYTGGLSSGE